MRNRQLVRVLRLVKTLECGWFALDSLASELRVSTRTIRRDIEALQEAHLPVRIARTDDGITRFCVSAR